VKSRPQQKLSKKTAAKILAATRKRKGRRPDWQEMAETLKLTRKKGLTVRQYRLLVKRAARKAARCLRDHHRPSDAKSTASISNGRKHRSHKNTFVFVDNVDIVDVQAQQLGPSNPKGLLFPTE
jgi:hypothetical protein